MVGYTLRQERERQNLSVDDIEQGTSIRAVYIEAIENGEYDELPGAVYTKGFIKNYAKFLGMDADAIVKEFNTDMAELAAEKEAAEAQAAAEAAAQNSEKPVDFKPTKPERKPLGHSIQDGGSRSSGLLIVAAVVFIAAIAGAAWSWLSSSDDIAQADKVPQQTQTVATEPTQPDNPPPAAEPTPPPPPPSNVINIQARFSNPCWTLVTVDGTVVQEGIIEGGQTLSWEGKNQITFRFGNAGAVELFQDGKSLGVPGAEGDIADKTFSRQ